MNYLFSRIPSILFEPFAVGALLGFAALLTVSRKRRSIFFWPILSSILLMLSWRLVCHSMMVSSRYSSVFIYPAVILTVCGCFQLELFCRWLRRMPWTKKISGSNRFCRRIPYLFVTGLAIACIVKTLYFNPYADVPRKISLRFLEDAKGCSNVHAYCVNTSEQNRILYYSKLALGELRILSMDYTLSAYQTLQNTLWDNRNISGRHYFFMGKKKQDKDFVPTPEIQKNGKWIELARYWTSRKKDQELILYRYEPFCRNVKEWSGKIPPLSKQNICLNGDFEHALSGKELEQRIAYYKKIKASDFYLTPGRLFPQAWWLGVSSAANGFFQEMALTANQPIAGKYSLEMNGSTGLNSASMPKQDCTFSGFIRGQKKSMVWIRTCFWDAINKKTVFIDTVCFCAQSGKTYRFSVPIFEKDVPQYSKSIYLIVQTNGHILLDQMECIPAGKTDTSDSPRK